MASLTRKLQRRHGKRSKQSIKKNEKQKRQLRAFGKCRRATAHSSRKALQRARMAMGGNCFADTGYLWNTSEENNYDRY